MKQFLILSTIFFIFSLNAFSQIEYKIEDFSDAYYAVFIMNEDQKEEVFKEGTMLVFDKKTGSTLVEVECESSTFEIKLTEGSKKIQVPYEAQSSLLYEDFNFDGNKDIAVQQYYSSKGPSYTIYIAKKAGFELDEDFTNLIQSSQGNWDLDPDSNKIYTRSSGGCCWHSYSTYSIQNGRPVLTAETVEHIDFAFTITTSKHLQEGKMIETVEKIINLEEEGITVIMAFNLKGKNKKVVLFNINDRTLNYALVGEEDIVEFNYPIETVYANPDFTLMNGGNDLVFNNDNAEYKIYQISIGGKISSVGILVKANGKTYDLKGDITTIKGNLSNIPKLDNVVFE